MVADASFLTWYVIELLLRVAVYRQYFFVNADCGWNMFDFVLIAFGVMELIFSQSDRSTVNPTFLRVIRLLKISKALRMVKVLRFIGELRLMLDCLIGCISPFAWSLGLVILVLMFFSLFFVQSVANYLGDRELLEQNLGGEDEIGSTGQTISDYKNSFGSVI